MLATLVTKLTQNFIEKLFFIIGISLICLSLYLFYVSKQNSLPTPHHLLEDSPELAPYLPVFSDAEHSYIQHNPSSGKPFGVCQYPKGTSLVLGSISCHTPPISPPVKQQDKHLFIFAFFASGEIYSKPNHLTVPVTEARTTLFFFNGRNYVSPIRLEYYPLITGFIFLLLPFTCFLFRRKKIKGISASLTTQ